MTPPGEIAGAENKLRTEMLAEHEAYDITPPNDATPQNVYVYDDTRACTVEMHEPTDGPRGISRLTLLEPVEDRRHRMLAVAKSLGEMPGGEAYFRVHYILRHVETTPEVTKLLELHRVPGYAAE